MEEVNKVLQREQNLFQRLPYEENILQQLKEDKNDLKQQLRQERQERQDDSKSYMERIRLISDEIEEKHQDTERELCQMVNQLNSQIASIQNEKESLIEKHRQAMDNLNNELLFQSKREDKSKERMNVLEDEVTRAKAELRKEAKLREEKDMEIEKLEKERKVLSENVTKMESKLANELQNASKRVVELRQEKDDEMRKMKSENDVAVEGLKIKMVRLEMGLEFQEKNVAKLQEEKEKVMEELKLQDDMKKEVDQLRSAIKTLEGTKNYPLLLCETTCVIP